MTLSAQEALIYVMTLAASSDTEMTEQELTRIDVLVSRLPVFEGYDRTTLARVANSCVDQANGAEGLESVLAFAVESLPRRLQDTAYALAVEVTAVDLLLEQDELRFLELLRDQLELDRLVTAAIETAARARYRKA